SVGGPKAEARLPQVGPEAAAYRVEDAVEQASIDPGMIGEILQVAHIGDGAGHVRVQALSAVPGDLEPVGGCDRGDPPPFGDPSAAGHVGLHDVDGPGFAHPPEVGEVVAVLAGGHVAVDRTADLAQPAQVV